VELVGTVARLADEHHARVANGVEQRRNPVDAGLEPQRCVANRTNRRPVCAHG
jgi:hypothetical protein